MIRGKQVVLRTVREGDLDALYGYMSDVAARGDYFPVRLVSEPAFRKQFQETGFFTEGDAQLLICSPDGEMLGCVWYFKTAPYLDGYEIGYHTFDPGRRGKGYMTEAVQLLVHHLFTTTKVNRLQGTVIPDNASSRRVAEKCGFRSEGILRGATYLGGTNHDLEMLSLLRSEATAPA